MCTHTQWAPPCDKPVWEWDFGQHVLTAPLSAQRKGWRQRKEGWNDRRVRKGFEGEEGIQRGKVKEWEGGRRKTALSSEWNKTSTNKRDFTAERKKRGRNSNHLQSCPSWMLLMSHVCSCLKLISCLLFIYSANKVRFWLNFTHRQGAWNSEVILSKREESCNTLCVLKTSLLN